MLCGAAYVASNQGSQYSCVSFGGFAVQEGGGRRSRACENVGPSESDVHRSYPTRTATCVPASFQVNPCTLTPRWAMAVTSPIAPSFHGPENGLVIFLRASRWYPLGKEQTGHFSGNVKVYKGYPGEVRQVHSKPWKCTGTNSSIVRVVRFLHPICPWMDKAPCDQELMLFVVLLAQSDCPGLLRDFRYALLGICIRIDV
jgi:hypothetical protein